MRSNNRLLTPHRAALKLRFMRALLIVDHGSRRAESNDMLPQMATLVQQRVGPSVLVAWAHMELAQPDIAQVFRQCVDAGAREVVVVPYMLGPGRHATEDIPRLAEAAASDHPGVQLRVAPPLGIHPLLAELVVHRAGFDSV